MINTLERKKLMATTNDIHSLLIKYWISKTISYCPDINLKGQRLYDTFKSSIDGAIKNQPDFLNKMPTRNLFYKELREAYLLGMVGADYQVNPTYVPTKLERIRRTDGLYFQNLHLNENRLYDPEIPILINNSLRENLKIRASQTGIEEFFISSAAIAQE